MKKLDSVHWGALVLLGATSFVVAAGCSDGVAAGGGTNPETATGSYAIVVNPDAMQPIAIGATATNGSPAVPETRRALLLRAATECRVGYVQEDKSSPRVSPNLEKSYARLNDTANLDVRKLFSSTPVDKCDRVLEQTEALVCMADKLAQVADAARA